MPKIATERGTARKSLLIGFLSWALAVPAFVCAQGPATGIVVFGDSLSDPGNAFALVGGTNTPRDYSQDFFLVPDKPYARGGHHFSDGATWIEQFARSKGLAGNVQAAFRGSSAGATNYAVGSARAHDDGSEVNLTHQVGRFLQDFGGAAPADALYVVEIGGNDIRDVAATGDGSIIAGALGAIQTNIVSLYTAGGRKFLVWNAPKVAVTPAIRTADALFPGAAAAVDGVTMQYNAALEIVLGGLEQALAGSQIVRFNAYDQVAAIYGNGAAFGLSEVNAPCITPNVAPFACQNPDDYMFWDGIHPTKAVHAIFAHEVAQLLAQ
jgi:phospholipase/lecithinase/hemolysin